MPELPEVEVVRRGLEPAVTGASVASVTVLDARSLRRHPGPSEDFIARLVGRPLQGVLRRGKFLWLPLDGVEALVIHLGMSGQVLLRAPDVDDPLTRIRLDLAHPVHGALRLNFADQRIFGSLAIDRLVETADAAGELIPSRVAHIARDPLDARFDDSGFLAALARRSSGIKRAILDQGLISGIGNIYADEALWAARIHYDQPASTLSRSTARSLLAELRSVLGKALAEGGTSFDSHYVNVNGASGYFAHSLNAYGRHGDGCSRCGRLIVRERFMNRGSHFCPNCQRLVPSS
ncbi:MAG: bifunctional DNA-formamidopyrimidine glycosylase/DNA-(apurinic or apyrimidinic site) lyase [Microbacteriaceae bacterium]